MLSSTIGPSISSVQSTPVISLSIPAVPVTPVNSSPIPAMASTGMWKLSRNIVVSSFSSSDSLRLRQTAAPEVAPGLLVAPGPAVALGPVLGAP